MMLGLSWADLKQGSSLQVCLWFVYQAFELLHDSCHNFYFTLMLEGCSCPTNTSNDVFGLEFTFLEKKEKREC